MSTRYGMAALTAALLSSGPALAIVVNDDFGAEGAATLGAPFHSVVRLDGSDGMGGFCTGALISSTAILTARHCVTGEPADAMTVSFTDGSGDVLLSRAVRGITSLTGGSELALENYLGNDISVLTLWEAVLDFPPFRLLASPIVGEVVRMVGFGDQGLGSTGTVIGTGFGSASRWAADNIVDAILQFDPDTMILTDFDDPSGTSNLVAEEFFDILDVPVEIVSSPRMLPTEGTTAPGDSGGPLLFWRGGEWVIGGVLTGGSGEGYGDISFWTGVSSRETRELLTRFGGEYYPDDLTPVPLPASGLLLLAGMGALALRRRAT